MFLCLRRYVVGHIFGDRDGGASGRTEGSDRQRA